MTGRPPRLLALLLVLGLAVGGGACGGDDDSDDSAKATTTTSAAGGDDGTTTTTAATGDATTTTGGGAATSAPPAAGGDDPGDGVIEVTISGGNVVGGVRRETVKQGSQVTLRVTSDVADEVHLHTYDLKVDLVPGQSADLTFLAKVAGVFEVELEKRGKKVLELEVRP
jgi:hypothetical protein